MKPKYQYKQKLYYFCGDYLLSHSISEVHISDEGITYAIETGSKAEEEELDGFMQGGHWFVFEKDAQQKSIQLLQKRKGEILRKCQEELSDIDKRIAKAKKRLKLPIASKIQFET